MWSNVRLLVGATLLLTASLAMAAPEENTGGKNEPGANHQEALRSDLAKFWGAKREVSVVQLRLYTKDSRFEVTPFTGIIPNDDFNVYYPSGLRIGYHLSEAFTVELSGALAVDVASDLSAFLTETVRIERAEIQEQFDSFYTTSLIWSPAYGKISLLGTKLTHFETYVGVGIGVFSTSNKDAVGNTGTEMKPSGNTILGFRWFISDRFSVRTEYRQHFFKKFEGGVSIPVELSLGIGITI